MTVSSEPRTVQSSPGGLAARMERGEWEELRPGLRMERIEWQAKANWAEAEYQAAVSEAMYND